MLPLRPGGLAEKARS